MTHKTRATTSSTAPPPISRFFSTFADFQHNPAASIRDEFHRLGDQRNWKKGSKTWRKNWNRCVNLEYNQLIGNHLSSLESWQGLCTEVGIEDVFPSIRKCKMALSCVFVNIVDLLDARRTGNKACTFKTVSQLGQYTRKQGKFFNRNVVKQDKLLRVLLKKLV